MTFGDALLILKRGGRVYRDGWNGQDMWLYAHELEGPNTFSPKGPIHD